MRSPTHSPRPSYSEMYPHFPVDGVSASLLSNYLFDRTMADRTNSNDLPATIHYTVDYLLRHDEVEAEEEAAKLRRDYTRSLYVVATTAPQWRSGNMWTLVGALEPSFGADDDMRGPKSLSQHFLAAAASFGKVELVKRLIEEGTMVTGETYFGSPLQCAAKGGRCDVMRILLEQPGADVNAGLSDRTPLSVAAFADNEHMVRLLLEPQYECARKGGSFQEAIIHAACGGHQELIELMKIYGIHSSSPSLKDLILLEAAHHGHANLVQTALDNWASPNGGRMRGLPIWYAASRGYDDVVRLLIARSANQWLHSKESALVNAVSHGFTSTTQLLLDHGRYDFNLERINKGVSLAPLKVAAEHGQAHMVRFILDRGFDLKKYRGVGEMAIKTAARNGYETVVRMLCEAGVDVNGPTESMSPMLAALCRGRQNIVETLIDLGAKRIDPEKSIYAKKFKDGLYPSGTKLYQGGVLVADYRH